MKDLTRRSFIRAIGTSTIALTLGRADSEVSASQQQKANIIFILTDDQRNTAMGCAGNSLVRTPNIDSLAARGVRFENAFVTLSICSPSRAACLTGRYGSATGVTSVPGTINENEKTIAHYLKEAGYRTGMVGKWHLGNSPAECGFDFATFFRSNGTYYNRKVIRNNRPSTADGYIEDFNVQQALEFIKSGSSSPFMLWLCTQVPHMDHTFDWPARQETLARYDRSRMPLPSTWQDDLKGKPAYLKESRSRKQALHYGYDKAENIRRHFQRYYAAITEMDAALGRIMKAVDDMGLRGNTYFIFMGDNGWFMGEHGFTSKVLPYEESIRVPMIIAGPDIEHGTDSHLVLNIDLPPTILELAQIPAPQNMHGSSLLPLLKNKKPKWREDFLYEAPTPTLGSRPLLALHTQRYKLIQTFEDSELSRVVFEELYDLEQDPKETKNLADIPDYSNVLQLLRGQLKRARSVVKSV